PYPLEFGFSSRMAGTLVLSPFWSQDAGRTGPEICITVAGMVGQQRLHQSYLGPTGRSSQRATDLVAAIRATVGTLFWSLEENFALWSTIAETHPIPDCHTEYDMATEPARANREQLYQNFRSGVSELESVLSSILATSTLEELKRTAAYSEPEF